MAKSSKKAPDATQAAAAMAVAGFNPDAMKAWQDVMTECGSFVMERLQQDMEAQQAMLKCTSPAELMTLQTQFFQTAMQQYTEQTTKVMQMMSDAAGKSVSVGIASRKYDDVPL